MAENPSNETDLQAFLEMAGRSLADAQGQLGTGQTLRSDIVLANAELEARVALKSNGSGRLSVQPISSADMVKSTINPATISTVRVNFVATSAESSPGKATTAPKRSEKDVRETIRNRDDVQRLESILGPLAINPTYEPINQRWVVIAQDARDRVVREILLPDE